MEKIPKHVVSTLIEAGRIYLHQDDVSNTLNPIKYHGYINRLHWRSWDEITADLPSDELVCLIRGLTLAEKLLSGWMGGSVSGVIWTFRELENRKEQNSNELAGWILSITENSYAPFGSSNFRAKSISEYNKRSNVHNQCISRGLEAERSNEEGAEKDRIQRKLERSNTAKYYNTKLRTDLIEELSNMSITEQLFQLANDTTYSVGFYPTKLASSSTVEILFSLDEGIRLMILRKLKGKCRGPWGRFKKRLLLTFGYKGMYPKTPWDRDPWC